MRRARRPGLPLHPSLWLRRARLWGRRVGLANKLAGLMILTAILSGLATYVVLTGSGPLGGPDPTTVVVLLNLDLVFLLLLIGLVGQRLLRLWKDRRSGTAGSRLHVRFVLLFSVVAVTPAILVAVFSALLITFGVEQWFNSRVSTALDESLAVAKAYLEEHRQIIGGDAIAMANDLNHGGMSLIRDQAALEQMVSTQAAVRGLTEAIVFDREHQIVARTGLAFSLELSVDRIPAWAYERADAGEVAVLTNPNDQRVRALVKLDGLFSHSYLFVGRFVDPKVIEHLRRTNQAVEEYQKLETTRSGLTITFSAIFALVALLLLVAAVWVGLTLANRMARPIMGLIVAAERVRGGDLTARVDEEDAMDELASLTRAFNRMTDQLDRQRQDLIDANRELDDRRRFTEAVLAGVSAGVIGLDAAGRVDLPNRSATDLLGLLPEAITGRTLAEVVPEMADLFDTVRRRPERPVQQEIRLRQGGRSRHLLVRIGAERTAQDQVSGYVVTFDDVTDLLSAQRQAAWADVARRIAHEIKNPLTPIQLSAERLKRKYLKEISSDRDVFTTCTDTIIRQVGDIGRMVDEFSAFARMPAPVMKEECLQDLLAQALFLARAGFADVTFRLQDADHTVRIPCDGRQIGQALTNVLKNAAEAIQGRDGDLLPPGLVTVTLTDDDHTVMICLEDNGKGLPEELRDRLTEPYVTTRAKGTGLGLAIVKKIMEDHGGELLLETLPAGGAKVSLIWRRTAPAVPPGRKIEDSHGA